MANAVMADPAVARAISDPVSPARPRSSYRSSGTVQDVYLRDDTDDW